MRLCLRLHIRRSPRANAQSRHNHVAASALNARASAAQLPPPRLDYRGIVEDVLYKSHNAFNRKSAMPVGTIQAMERLYASHKDVDFMLNSKRAEHNALIKRVKDSIHVERDRALLINQARALKAEVHDLEHQLAALDEELLGHAVLVPNDTHPDTPIGSEAAAAVLSHHGPEPVPATPVRDHLQIARRFHLADFHAGAMSTGASWYYLLNAGALLELALAHYALSIAVARGFTPVLAPDVVRADIAARCGFQPRDAGGAQQLYTLGKDGQLVLAATAEVPLAALFANMVFEPHALPRRVVALGHAFRAEAGARGADTRGLFRVHQFSKVELFAVTPAGDSEAMMEEMRAVQTEIFSGLGFPFRVLDMPTEELGASAYRKYDTEAWMPGRGKWGEIASTSNCTDYQARRLHIRYGHTRRTPQATADNQVERPRPSPFAHTLNGTAAAIPRLIVALLENGAQIDNNGAVCGIDLPASLRQFWLARAEQEHPFIRWV